jgi:zinc transporter ZupT
MERDAEHLRLLSLFHYIRGGICALFSCFFLLYFFMGLFIGTAQLSSHSRNLPPPELGFFLAVFGCLALLVGWTWAGLQIFAGRCLAQRKHHTFCLIVAGMSCLLIPYGTILGVFTLMVLQRPSVRQLFEQPPVLK